MSLVKLESLPENSSLEAGVCIVGSGPAGISLALALDQAHVSTILLEAGGFQANEEQQMLYDTESRGLPYSGRHTRQRQFGGSSNCWSGWCRPLDPVDFEEKPGAILPGWPIAYEEYARYLAAAHELCELGSNDYRLDTWRSRLKAAYRRLPSIESSKLREGVWQHSPPTRFGPRYRHRLEKSAHCTVVLHASATSVRMDDDRIQTLKAQGLRGKQVRVRAKLYVLACGGIENARLLLTLNKAGRGPIGNEFDQVGRCFTDHAIIHDVLDIFPTKDHLGLYVDMIPTAVKHPHAITPWLGLKPGYLAASRIDNTTWRLQRPESIPAVGASSRLVWQALGAAHTGLPEGYGHPARMAAVAIVNHSPNPDSRITLARRLDALGTPQASIDWRLADHDLESIRHSLGQFAMEVMRLGIARCSPVKNLPNDGNLPFWPGNHHYGTTRMSANPCHGVVNSDCRVHSVDNLYIAGSSIFPSPGAATPTLSVVTLALRLADHLNARLSPR